MPLPLIPRDTLRATYDREAPYRPHWPLFDQAIADPVILAILQTLARHQVPAHARRDADRARIGLPALDGSTQHATRVDPPAQRLHVKRQAGLDFKSRAAGERDDE